MGRAVKLAVLGLLLAVIVGYGPVYYHTMLFNQFVHDQVPRIRSQVPLKEAILSKAEEHKLQVTAEDISMTTSDSVLRVSVVYHVPVNFFVFHRSFTFNAAGSGLLLRNSY